MIIIGCEGKDEVEYFKDLRVRFLQSSISVIVLERDPGKIGESSPRQVLDDVESKTSQMDISNENGDTVWVVIDTDRWRNHLPIAESRCAKNGWDLCINSPCFEIWIALHFWECSEIPETPCKPLKTRVGRKKGEISNSDKEFFDILFEQLPVAFGRAMAIPSESKFKTSIHELVLKMKPDLASIL